MKKLESLDLLSNTAIILISDHGEDLHDHITEADVIPPIENPAVSKGGVVDHGHTLYDEVINIPMIFYLPGIHPKKNVIHNQVRLIDVKPTIHDYLGIPIEKPVQGTSLLPLIVEGERAEDPPAISEYMLSGPERKSVRMNGYKYVYIPDMEERKDDVSYSDVTRHALFDLTKDPGEKNNIYSQKTELGKKYHRILEETLEESLGIKGEIQKNSPTANDESTEIPQDIIEGLKALGYIQ